MPHTEELVWITTDDGVRHDGVVIRPSGPPTGTTVVVISGGNIDASRIEQLRSGTRPHH